MPKQVKGSDVLRTPLVLLPHSVDTSVVEAEVLDCVTVVWVLMSVKSFLAENSCQYAQMVTLEGKFHLARVSQPAGLNTRNTDLVT